MKNNAINQTENTVNIESLKKGDYFKFHGKKKVYVYQGYNFVIRKYEYSSFDDINQFGHRVKGTQVVTDFEF